ncbi:MAG: hypothetical protein IPL65_13205 [Lewinellaceae bacterium]|nr:hypothetical protein [Lewinellaceae bacterium]
MLNRNTIVTGLVVGILMPAFLFAVLYNVFHVLEGQGLASSKGLSENFRERTLAILAIAINLIPMNVYKKRRWELAMRGVVIATALFAFAWVFRYGLKML